MGDTNEREIEWKTSKLPEETKAALDFFAKQEWLKSSSWYLAGGTALSMYAGHRISFDVDFFLPEAVFSSSSLIANLPKEIWISDIVKEDTVYGRLGGAKVSFIANSLFVPKQNPHWYGNIRVLDIKDIAVMKIVAVSQRGKRRDFIDLYWYSTHEEPLLEVIKKLQVQYPSVAHDYHHILKSLTYFADAEEDPMPQLFFEVDWQKIKKYFKEEAALAAKNLNLLL